MSTHVGIGIVGFGKWPRQAYVPAMKALDDAEVVAVAARSDQTLAAARAAFAADLALYHNYHDLLANDAVDAVMVATPNALHGEVVTWALRAGKHVFVEAPFGDSAEQAFRLLDEADDAADDELGRLVFQADLELGYIPVLRRVRELLADGTLGDPVSATVRLWCDWGFGGKAESPEAIRLGPFVWVGPWYFQVLDVLLGRLPRRVGATGVRAMNGELIDHGWTSLDYGDGVIGRFDFNLVAIEGEEIRVEAVGTRGEARADLSTGEVRWRSTDSGGWRLEHVPHAEPIAAFAGMRECVESFVRAIARGEPVLADAGAARRVHQVAFAAQQAADEGAPVELDVGE